MGDDGDIIINAKVDIKTSGKDKAKKDIQDIKNEAEKAVRDVTATARLPRGREKIGSDEPEFARTNNNVSTKEFEKAAAKIEKSIDKFSRLVDRIDSKVYNGTEEPNERIPGKYQETELATIAAKASAAVRASMSIKNELTGTTSNQQRLAARAQASDIYKAAGGGAAGLKALDEHIARIKDMQKQSGFPTYMIPMMQGAKDTLQHVKQHKEWMGKVIQEQVWTTTTKRPLPKIISGGQTGADQAGLRAAKTAGYPTGGWAPDKFKTETGLNPDLAKFGLQDSGKDYVGRTNMNAAMAELTLWFGQGDSAGRIATERAVNAAKRKFLDASTLTPAQLAAAIEQHHPSVVNIAGNRESKSPGIGSNVETTLTSAFDILARRYAGRRQMNWVKRGTGFFGRMNKTRTTPATANALRSERGIEGEDVVGTDLDETLKNINPFAFLFGQQTEGFTKMSPGQYTEFAKMNRDHPDIQQLAKHLVNDNAIVMSARLQPWLKSMGDAQAASLGLFQTIYSSGTDEKIKQIIKHGITTFIEDDPITAKRLREGLAKAGHYGTSVMHTDQYLANKTGQDGFDLKSMVRGSQKPDDVIRNLRGLIKAGSLESSVVYNSKTGEMLSRAWGYKTSKGVNAVNAINPGDRHKLFQWLREAGEAGITIAHQHPNGGMVPSYNDLLAYHSLASTMTASERAKFKMAAVGSYGHTEFSTTPDFKPGSRDQIMDLMRTGDFEKLKSYGILATFRGMNELTEDRPGGIDRSKLGKGYESLTDAQLAAMQDNFKTVWKDGKEVAVRGKSMKGLALEKWLDDWMTSLRGGIRQTPEGAHMQGGVPPASPRYGIQGTMNEWGGTFAKQFKNYLYRNPEHYEKARKEHLMGQIEAQHGSELFTPSYLYNSKMRPWEREIASRFYKSQYKISIPYADSGAGASMIEHAKELPGIKGYHTGDKAFRTALGEQQMHAVTLHGEMSDRDMVKYQDKLRNFAKGAADAGGTRGSPQIEITTKTSAAVQRYSLMHDIAAVSVQKLTKAQRALFMGQMQALGLYFSTQSILRTFTNTLQTITTPLSNLGGIFKDIGLGIAFGKKGSASVEMMKGMLHNTQGIVTAWKNFQGAQAAVHAGFAKLAVTLFSNDIFMERLYLVIDKFFEAVSDPQFIKNILAILQAVLQALPTIIEEVKWFIGALKMLTDLPGAVPIVGGILAVGFAAQFVMGALAALSAVFAGIKAVLVVLSSPTLYAQIVAGLTTLGVAIDSIFGAPALAIALYGIAGFFGLVVAGIGAGFLLVYAGMLAGVDKALVELGKKFKESNPVLSDLLKVFLWPLGALGTLVYDVLSGEFDHIVGDLEAVILKAVAAASRLLAGAVSIIPFVGTGWAATFNASAADLDARAAGLSKRADGGPVRAGETYLVGERGPELFTAMANGNITSNAELRKGTSGGATEVRNNYQQTINIGSINNAADLDRIMMQTRQQNIYGQRPLSG